MQDHLYTTYTRARIEQLFNIIIEWPDSQPALEDVRLCLASQPELRSHLTASLKVSRLVLAWKGLVTIARSCCV